MIDATPDEMRPPFCHSELWIAEIQLLPPPRGEVSRGVRLKETPHIKILNAILPVEIVQCPALTQGNGKKPIRVEAACVWLALEQVGAITRGNLPQALQIHAGNTDVRTPRHSS